MAQKLKKANTQKTSNTSSITTSSFNNLLLANVEANSAAENIQMTKINKRIQQCTVLNKPQLQQTLIHLLTTDDKFLTSLHQAYLETNLSLANQQKKNNTQQLASNIKPLLLSTSSTSLDPILTQVGKIQN